MKKVFSLILAVAMVLSLASVAFAATQPWDVKSSSSTTAKAVKTYDNTKFYLYDSDTHEFYVPSVNPTFGKTIFYPLYVSGTTVVATEDKSVSSLKLSVDVEEGAAYVASASIVKKYGKCSGTDFTGYNKASVDKFNGYYIAITTQGSNTSTKDVSGMITLTGKSGDTKIKDEAVHFAFQLAWATATPATTSTSLISYNFNGNLAKDKNYVVTGDATVADTKFEFNDDVTFEVDMVNGEKTVIKYTEDVNKAIEDANDLAGITFYNFFDTSFKRSGELQIVADDDEPGYLYEILADGSLKDITSTYDEEEGAFVLKVKKLTTYCTSDLKLVDAEGTVAAAVEDVNPVTGAIA